MKALRTRGGCLSVASMQQRPFALAPTCARRGCAFVPAQEISPVEPVVHATIADAHIHASGLLAELLDRRPPTSLSVYVQLLEEWWRAVGRLVLLPFDAEAINDLPQYLIECGGMSVKHDTHHERRARSSTARDEEEAALLERWEEWVWSSEPRTMPTAAAFSEEVEDAPSRSAAQRREVMSFPELTSLLHSYSRYHRGVQWGAARHGNGDQSAHGGPAAAAAAAAYYRRRYLLHPWHGLCCPEGTTEQMPYVHVLRWMLAGAEGKASPEELWRHHRAVEDFHRPLTTPSPFRALDVCSQSGYVTDLLLRAGADLVVAADPNTHALGNTESTYHEHLREGRSKQRNQVLLTRRCDTLPMPKKAEERRAATMQLETQMRHIGDQESDGSDATSASAAAQRRQRARREGRGYSGVRADATPDGGAVPTLSGDHRGAVDGSPFHVVYIHPPAPSVVWPVIAAHGAPPSLHHTAWWQSLVHRAAEVGVPSHLLLPFVPCDAVPPGVERSPLTTLSGLRRVIDALRSDVTERRVTPVLAASEDGPSLAREAFASGGGDALLSEDGYVALVLPRTYDVDLLLQGQLEQQSPSLADWVVAQLDGYYDLVLRRRCLVHAASSASANTPAYLDAVEEALVTHPRRVAVRDERDQRAEATASESDVDSAAAPDVSKWRRQLSDLYRTGWWQDVLVLKKNATMVRRCAAAAAARGGTHPLVQQRLAMLRKSHKEVAWEDTFEYNEHHPRDAPGLTSHHWTNLLPTYSYLESDFYDSASAQRNFLAVGHQPAPLQAKSTSAGYGVPSLEGGAGAPSSATGDAASGVAEASAEAAMNFHTLFAQELRTRRRSKLRKLALSPLERQEWYIDEKLIKSSGARVELMNELSKWDLKDYDN